METSVWKVTSLESVEDNGGVFLAIANYTKTETLDNGKEVFYSKSTYAEFTFDAESETFIPFEELTEEEVLSWIWETNGNKQEIEDIVNQGFASAKLKAQNTPVVSRKLPTNWDN